MIRHFKTEDAERCAQIINECHKSMPELKRNELKLVLNKYTPEFTSEAFPKEFVLVYEDDAGVQGLGALLEGAELRWIYIDPKKQKQGIGKAILKMLEEEAKNRGFKKVVCKSYYGSKTFYEQLGYIFVREDVQQYEDAIFHSLVMEKEI